MPLKVSSSDGVKVYNVSSGKTIPQWLSEGKKKALKKDEDYRRRLELIQDFEFPAAAHRIKATADGAFIYASGIHPPRVRCYELSQLSLKFERHLDSEIVDFEILSDDYSKVAFLCADRSINLHAKFGAYYKIRIPRFGRDLAYHPYNADLLIAGSSNEIFRLNLEEGRFQESFSSNSPGINKLGISPSHGLVAAAGEEGLLECFDIRQERLAGRFDASTAVGSASEALTALRFDETGLMCAVGTSNGLVAIFDLRSSKALTVKDHMYSSPIVDLKFKESDSNLGFLGKTVVSADKNIVRIWEANSGRGITSIQPPAGGINDLLLWKDSGLIMLACDSPKMLAYFIPTLGPAPKWSSFLENLTEELEETANPTIYDDYRFVTRPELDSLGMGHLVGTNLLRAYMHGFFMHNKLWQKAKAIAAPVDYATVRKERIQSKMEADRAQRITLKRKLPKVNALYAAKMMADEEGVDGAKKKVKGGQASLMADDRFKTMFEDPAFAINEQAEEYKVLHPNAESKRHKKLVEEHFEALDSEGDQSGDEDSIEKSDAESGAEDSEDEDSGKDIPKPESEATRLSQKKLPSRLQNGLKSGGSKLQRRQGAQMLAAKSDAAAQAFQKRESLAALQGLLLAERAERAVLNHGKGNFRIGGQKEMTFTPRGGRSRGGRSGGRSGGSFVRGGRTGRGRDQASSSRGRSSSFSSGRSSGRGRGRGPSRGGRSSRGRRPG